MNILLINHYVGGTKYGMEFRPYYLAKEWIKLGHTVTFIGASYSHLRYHQPSVLSDFYEENLDGIRYLWIKTPEYHTSFMRIINMLSFVLKLCRYEQCIANMIKADCVIASSTYPLDIYPARKIAKLLKAKLVFEVHDLWPMSPMVIGGYSKWHPFILLMQKAENDAYKYSDVVVSLLWNAKEHMVEHGLDDQKFVCIPNGFCKSEWDMQQNEIPNEHLFLLQKLKSLNKVIIGFAGGFAASGALQTLIETAIILKDNVDIAFVLVGKGSEKRKLEHMKEEHTLSNVFFLPPVEKSQVPGIVSSFDIAYLGGVHSILHKYGTAANKLTDYMLSALPVLFSVDEPNSLVERVECGICVPAESPQLLSDAIKRLIDLSPELRKEMGERGRIYAINNLEYSHLATQFLQRIE